MNQFYPIALDVHSGMRYVVMLTLIIAILLSFGGWLGKTNYKPLNKRINLFALISAHIQFVFGLILYFMSPFVKAGDMSVAMKDDNLRYWTVEHVTMMLIAIALITVGYSKSKRIINELAKHRTIAVFYTIAFVIIIIAILLSKRPVIDL